MLYPSQDRDLRRLTFRCRNCGQSEEVEENCIYVNELVKDTRYVPIPYISIACGSCDAPSNANYVSESYGSLPHNKSVQLDVLPGDIIDDPTLQRDYDVTCPMCSHNGAVFIRSHDGVKQATLGLIWVCLNRDCQVDEDGNRLPTYRWMG